VGELAVRATTTVTFFRAKPGHLLAPGRDHCGAVTCADIGIPARVLAEIQPTQWRNDPALWADAWPWRSSASHKYRHGHAVVVGGATATGAARLGARAALRTGAGLVTLAVPASALAIYAAESASLITTPLADPGDLDVVLGDPRKNAVLIGPGAGVDATTRQRVQRLASDGRACVLDADALTAFADAPAALAELTHERVVVTPHAGEFARLFPDLAGDKLSRARAAAAELGAVVVLKGADTVVAAPDGRAAIADNGPPALATAGSGDVLAGIVTGALAQGLAPFAAACAGVWLLGEAARAAGPGLISADLPERLPAALAGLPR
jgi:NAD(P)H-hydrate epimerase